MKPFLRISDPGPTASDAAEPKYQEALVKLIPTEVVGLYLGGKNAIEARENLSDAPAYWLVWTLVCLIGLVIYRRYATMDTAKGIPPEWPAVALSAISFVVWIYSFGDVFKLALPSVWDPLVATLLVLAWTFAVPLIHRSLSSGSQT